MPRSLRERERERERERAHDKIIWNNQHYALTYLFGNKTMLNLYTIHIYLEYLSLFVTFSNEMGFVTNSVLSNTFSDENFFPKKLKLLVTK